MNTPNPDRTRPRPPGRARVACRRWLAALRLVLARRESALEVA